MHEPSVERQLPPGDVGVRPGTERASEARKAGATASYARADPTLPGSKIDDTGGLQMGLLLETARNRIRSRPKYTIDHEAAAELLPQPPRRWIARRLKPTVGYLLPVRDKRPLSSYPQHRLRTVSGRDES
jgi:hypothetical protein